MHITLRNKANRIKKKEHIHGVLFYVVKSELPCGVTVWRIWRSAFHNTGVHAAAQAGVSPQVRWSWQQALLSAEVRFKVLELESVGVVYIARDFLSLSVVVPDEDDGLQQKERETDRERERERERKGRDRKRVGEWERQREREEGEREREREGEIEGEHSCFVLISKNEKNGAVTSGRRREIKEWGEERQRFKTCFSSALHLAAGSRSYYGHTRHISLISVCVCVCGCVCVYVCLQISVFLNYASLGITSIQYGCLCVCACVCVCVCTWTHVFTCVVVVVVLWGVTHFPLLHNPSLSNKGTKAEATQRWGTQIR